MRQKSVNFRHASSSFSFYIESEIEGRKKRCFDDGCNDDRDDGVDGDGDGNDNGVDDVDGINNVLTRFKRLLSLYIFREMLIFCSEKIPGVILLFFPT